MPAGIRLEWWGIPVGFLIIVNPGFRFAAPWTALLPPSGLAWEPEIAWRVFSIFFYRVQTVQVILGKSYTYG
jgi:hypothetical protein